MAINLAVKLEASDLSILLAAINEVNVDVSDLTGLFYFTIKKGCIAKIETAVQRLELKGRKSVSVTFTLAEAAFIDLIEFDTVSAAMLHGYFKSAGEYFNILAKNL